MKTLDSNLTIKELVDLVHPDFYKRLDTGIDLLIASQKAAHKKYIQHYDDVRNHPEVYGQLTKHVFTETEYIKEIPTTKTLVEKLTYSIEDGLRQKINGYNERYKKEMNEEDKRAFGYCLFIYNTERKTIEYIEKQIYEELKLFVLEYIWSKINSLK